MLPALVFCRAQDFARLLKTDSGVGNHARNLLVVGVRDERAVCQLALGLGLHRRKDVAHLRLAANDFASTSLLEALCSAPVCFQFGHGYPACDERTYSISKYTGMGPVFPAKEPSEDGSCCLARVKLLVDRVDKGFQLARA